MIMPVIGLSMIYNKKIRIAFFISNIILCQAMEYYEAPQQETYTTHANEIQPQYTPSKPPVAIQAEYSQKSSSLNNTKKVSSQDTKKTKTTTQNPTSKPVVKNEINFNQKPNSSTKSTAHNTTLDSSASERLDTTSKIYAATINQTEFTAPEEQTNQIDHQELSSLTEGSIDTLSQLLTSSLDRVLSKVPRSRKNVKSQPAIESLKNEIQYLSEQVQKYNTISFYTDINLMVTFIKNMNDFIKQSKFVTLSTTNVKNLDIAYSAAVSTSNIFKKQNIILNQNSIPNEVLQNFTLPINDSQNLIEIKDMTSMIHAIYDTNGSMNLIFDSWQKFMASPYSSVTYDLYYGAFITFLLIFQDTVTATTSILNETSGEFQVTNPLEMKGVNYSAPKGSDTNVNNSLSTVVSSD